VIDERGQIRSAIYVEAKSTDNAAAIVTASLPWYQSLVSVENVVERVARW
jgi:hypothetical protein